MKVITTQEFLEREAITGNLSVRPSEDVLRLKVKVRTIIFRDLRLVQLVLVFFPEGIKEERQCNFLYISYGAVLEFRQRHWHRCNVTLESELV